MTTDMDFGMYFNIAFLSILGLGILFGFIKGFKKSLWSFLVTLIFFAFFFLTIDRVVNVLWTINMPFLGGLLANVNTELESVTSLFEALPILLGAYLPGEFAATATNANLLEFITSISLFVVKIVYTILYFTVIQVLYRLILWILRMIIVPSKKKTDKYKSKNRLLGSVFGLLQGGISVYLTLIIFGGIISIASSVASIVPNANPTPVRHIEYREEFRQPTASIIQMAAIALPDGGNLDDAMDLLEGMIEGYETNILVTYQNTITITDPYDPEGEMPLNLYLFDSVLSMNYQEEQIAFRAELDVLTQVAANVINSDFMESGDVGDLTGEEVRAVFTDLGKSHLITSIIPLAVEVASEAFEVDLELPLDELYEIEWDIEIMQLGEVAASALDIVNAAGVFNGSFELDTIVLDGDEVEQLFVSLGQSELVTLAAFVAIEPILEIAGEGVSAFITVPTDLDWAAEFAAIGALAGEVLNSGLTVGAVNSGDIGAILPILANIDFTVLLDSKIITNAMINILSGQTSIDISEFITIPDGIQWLNLEVDGETVYGELYNILMAINALAKSAGNIDFNDFQNLSLNTIAQFTADDINALFESKILVATITSYLTDLDLGDGFTIIMPDSAFDEDGYIKKTELQNVVNAVFMLVNELACPVDKVACQDLGVDIDLIFTLDGEDLDTLLASDVLAASAGNLVLELGGDMLTVPGSALVEIFVDDVARDVVSRAEIKAAFLAISTLGISSIDNLAIDPSILTNLAVDGQPTVLDSTKADKLFGSKILNATLSSYLFDFATGAESFIVVPYFAENNSTEIRVIDPIDSTEYISEDELTNILQAVLVLDITDFENIDQLDIASILADVDVLLDSSILHATISKMLIDMDDIVAVPLNDQAGDPLKITVGTGVTESTYIAKIELENVFDALSVLNITDIEDVAIDLTILENLAVEGEPTVLDTAKSTRLFSSSIINATLAKYLLDFTGGAEALVVVPYEDQDGTTIRFTDAADGTEYIVESELTNILKAVLVLDITDFENIENIDIGEILSNVSTLLDSAILHATVSKQLLDLDTVIVVPTSNELGDPVKVITGPVGNETTFIEKAELEAVFDALSVLQITDIADVAIDLTILEELAVEGQPTVLDTNKSDTLFASAVINATLSKFLIDFSEGDSAILSVPYEDQNTVVIRVVDPVDGVEMISQAELTNILKAVLALDITDFENIDNINIDVILSNVSVLLDSAILHATISKQLMDLDTVIVVPTNNELGDPVKLVTGPLANETTFIEKAELEAVFDALTVLGIDDINNVTMDMTIIGNLAEDGDDTALDMLKADILFSSAVINATLSKYIMDFSAGDDPFLVVPDNAQDGTVITVTDPVDSITVIAELELTNVLKAVLLLDLQSFDSVESLDLNTILGNVSAILDSSIMHASISKQFLDLGDGIVTIPTHHENDDALIITQGTVDFINRLELEHTFEALEVLGMSDISNMSVDITKILDNLGEDLDPTVLDNSKANTLFSSTILKATIAKYILDFSEGATPILQVPQINESNVYIKTQNSFDTTVFINQDELTSVLSAILALGLSDFDNVSTLSLDVIIANKTAILDSAILQATVSQQLIDLGGGTVIIPEFEDDNVTEVLVTKGDVGQEMTFIARLELDALFDALEILDIGNLDSFDGGVDLSVLNEPGAVHTLVQSAILQATISAQVLDLAGGTGETLVIIPYQSPDGLVQLRRTIGVTSPVEMIEQLELEHLIDAFVALGFTDVDNLELAISISTLTDNAATIFESYTLQATVSKQVLDLESATVVIPYYDDNVLTPTRLRNISGPALEETEFIAKDELIALMAALDVLIPEGEGVENFDGAVDISLFYEVGPRTILISSSILQATISKQIVDLGAAIEVPLQRDDLSVVRLTAGTILAEQNEYLVDDEIHALFEALELLGMDDIGDFDGNNLSFDIFLPSHGLGYEDNQNTLLASACIQATVSKQIIDLAVGDTLIIPTKDYNDNDVRVLVGLTDYLLVSEIKSLFNALDVLELDINNFSGDLGLTNLFESSKPLEYADNQTTMLASAIMHATMSDQILSLSSGGAILIPTTDKAGNTFTKVVETVYYIEGTEIKHLLNAMDAMGFGSAGSLGDFGGTVSFASLTDSNNQDTMLLSIIMHSTLSDKIFDLSVGATPAILIPTTDFDDLAIHETVSGNYFIEKIEIKALIDAMNVLSPGGDLDGFSGTIGLTSLMSNGGLNPDYQTNQVLVLSSAIMHRTITNQIADLGVTALVVPDTDIDSFAIDATISTNFFITKAEIQHLFDAMDILGVGGDLSSFDGTIDLSAIADDASQNTLLLSAIMHATLSDKLIDSALNIPDIDINRLGGAVALRVTPSSTEFIEKIELKKLLIALDEMDMTDFGAMTPSLGVIFTKDMNVILDSAIMQTTISFNFLSTAKTYDLASSGEFIVPEGKREAIAVETVAKEWIEVTELKALIAALSELGISSFDVSIDGSTLNGKTEAELTTILASASMHLTAENMIKQNANINSYVPDITGQAVIIDSLYGETDIVSSVEVIKFILAIDAFGGSLEGDFDSSVLSGLTNAEQLTVIASAIARCKMTPELVTAMALNFTPYGPTDYETLDTTPPATCLTEAAAEDALALY
ncbi:MAG: hypothetical protein JEZ05_01010 [Tenericutes bacterium]|nr:hypothetical protein [Mycoplasmatota bacterium]